MWHSHTTEGFYMFKKWCRQGLKLSALKCRWSGTLISPVCIGEIRNWDPGSSPSSAMTWEGHVAQNVERSFRVCKSWVQIRLHCLLALQLGHGLSFAESWFPLWKNLRYLTGLHHMSPSTSIRSNGKYELFPSLSFFIKKWEKTLISKFLLSSELL